MHSGAEPMISYDEAVQELIKIERILIKHKALADYRRSWEKGSPHHQIGLNYSSIAVPPSILDYYILLNKREYSFLLADGSLIQIGMVFDADTNTLLNYRYYFCNPHPYRKPYNHVWGATKPFVTDIFYFLLDRAIDIENYIGDPKMWYELLENAMDEFSDNGVFDSAISNFARTYLLPASIRFDYDVHGRNEIWHPLSHATFFSKNVRLAVDHLLPPSLFVAIAIAHFSQLEETAISLFHELSKISKAILPEGHDIKNELLKMAKAQKLHISFSL